MKGGKRRREGRKGREREKKNPFNLETSQNYKHIDSNISFSLPFPPLFLSLVSMVVPQWTSGPSQELPLSFQDLSATPFSPAA